MNMISTGAFLNEMDASTQQKTVAEKFAAVWEKKNAKAARAGGVSLMALSLAACGGSSSTTTTTDTSTDTSTDTTTETTTTPVVTELALTTSTTDAVTGTDGVDEISGVVSSLAASRTLQATDTIDGGAGTDTAKFDVSTAFTGFTTGSMKNVEVVEITNSGSVARTFDTSGVTGATQYTLSGAVNLSDMAEIVTVKAGARTADMSLTYASKVTDGTADSLDLDITGFGTADDATTTTKDETDAVKVTVAGVETTNFTVTGVNVVDTSGVASKALTATGSGSFEVTAIKADTKTVDASGVAGAVDLTLANGATMTSIKTGAGADTIRNIADSDLAANATVAAGDGADTMVITSGGAATVQYKMTGVETLKLGDLGGALTMSLADSTDVNAITVLGAAATEGDMDEAATISSAGTGAMTIDVQGQNASAKTLSVDSSGAGTITVSTPASGATASSKTDNDINVTMSKASSVDLDVNALMAWDGTLTAAKATSATVTIDGATTSNAALTTAKATSVVIDAVAADSVLTVSAASATEMTITNAKKLDVGSSTLTALENLTSSGKGALDFDSTDIAAAATINITNTGDVDLKAIGAATLDNAIVATFSGNKTLDTKAIKTNGQNITITASNMAGANTFDAIDAKTTGNVSVTVDGADTLGLKAITGKDVTIDVANNIGAVTFGGDITVSGDLTVKGSELNANDIATKDVKLDGASNTVDFTGGIGIDKLDVIGDTTTTSVTIKGDFGLGTDVVTLDLATNDLTAAATIDVTGMSNYDGLTITASDKKANTIKLGSDAEVDTIVYTAVDVKHTITGFQTGTTDDVINVEKLGSDTGNIAGEAAVAAGDTVADAFDTSLVYVFADGATAVGGETIADYTDTVDVLAFLNAALTVEAADKDGAAVINDLANDKAYIYDLDVDSAGDTDIEGATLIGVISLADADTAFTTDHTAFTA